MALRVDTLMVLVPATWDVPGAGAIPTTRNKDCAEGRLEALPADVGEILTAGMKLPGALFEAEGRYAAGRRVGVRVGVYDTGGGDPIALVEDAVARLTPDASVNPTNICGQDAVRTLRSDDGQGGAAICDYWGRILDAPTSFLVLRFWRTGPGDPDEEELFDNMAGSVLFGGGVSWAGPLRPLMLRRYGPPRDSEPHEPGRWRFAGWRLGTVFRTKMLAADDAAMATEMGVKRRDALFVCAVLIAWLAATVAIVGVGWVQLLGLFATVNAMLQLRSQGVRRAVVLQVEILAALLVFGLAIS